MNLIHTTKPSKIQKAHMTNLVNTCKAAEPLSLSAPVEDDLGYDILLLYEDGDQGPLAAMSFLFFPQEGPCECCVFVDPKKRRRGHFSLLLDKTLDLVDAYEKAKKTSVDFCFLADERTPSAMAAITAIGAEYWYSEHRMERPLTSKDKQFSLCSLTIETDSQDPNLYCAMQEGRIIGTCAILPWNSQIYLYAFQIHEAYRGQGLGQEFLLGILSILADMGTQVTIQVSGQNYIARNLYKKTGFRTTESLSYYLY